MQTGAHQQDPGSKTKERRPNIYESLTETIYSVN